MAKLTMQQEGVPTDPGGADTTGGQRSRREFLGRAAFGAGMASGLLMLGNPAFAEDRGRPVDPGDHGRDHHDDDDGGGQNTWQPLPPDAPISMILTPDLAQMLTPGALQATTQDLVSLATCGDVTRRALSLTISDLQSLQSVFTPLLVGASGGHTGGGCCCCCGTACCCCSCAPVQVVGNTIG